MFEIANIQEIDGDADIAHTMLDGKKITYTYYAKGFRGYYGDAKKALLEEYYSSIPDCDTVIWRERPYFTNKDEITKLCYRAIFLKDGQSIGMHHG